VNQANASDFILAGATAIGVGGEMLPKEAYTFARPIVFMIGWQIPLHGERCARSAGDLLLTREL